MVLRNNTLEPDHCIEIIKADRRRIISTKNFLSDKVICIVGNKKVCDPDHLITLCFQTSMIS